MVQEDNKWIAKNLLAGIAFLLGVVLVIQIFLAIGTKHNREIAVPDFSNMSISDAEKLADRTRLRLDVTDSIFNKHMERGAVFSQNPVAGSHVKKGRRILITINALQPQTVEMPDLVGYSLRQAKTVLQSKGLQVGKLAYQSDIATNNVLDQSIEPGEMVETETKVHLVLGLNPENEITYVPHVIGYTYTTAADAIIESSLNIGRVRYDETVETYEDSLQAVVYSQSPYGGENSPCRIGSSVSLTLTKSAAKITAAEKKARNIAAESQNEE